MVSPQNKRARKGERHRVESKKADFKLRHWQ